MSKRFLLFLGGAGLLAGAGVAAVTLIRPDRTEPSVALVPVGERTQPTGKTAEPKPRGPNPCAEPIRIERVEMALARAERDPSVRACIETPPPKEEALRTTYARFLWFKAMGFRELGDADREMATLQESMQYDPQIGTQVAIGSVLYREGQLDEARKQLAATALMAMNEGASAPVLEDLFFTQVLVDRDAYEQAPDQFGLERLCRSAGRFLQLATHHPFAEGNVKVVRELQAMHCPDSGKP